MQSKMLTVGGSTLGVGGIVYIILSSPENMNFIGRSGLVVILVVAMLCLSFGDKISQLFGGKEDDGTE